MPDISIENETVAARAADRSYAMSGHAYVAAMYRDDFISWTTTGGRYRHLMHRLPLATNCTHGVTICAACAPSWSIDRRLMLWRTHGGRKLAAELGIQPHVDLTPTGGFDEHTPELVVEPSV